MKTIKELLDTRYELRRQTLQAVVTSFPLDTDGKSKGYVVATVAGYANEHVLIGPNDTYYVGDAITVEQVGSPGMAYYRAIGVTTPTRRGATGFYSFTGSTALSGSTYQAGDIVIGDPASAHGVFTSSSIGFKYSGSTLTTWSSSGFQFPSGVKKLWTRTLVVDAGGKGDYTTVKAACDYVATQLPSLSSQWLIICSPGVYAEDDFTIPSYTTVRSLTVTPLASVWMATRIEYSGGWGNYPGGTFITMQANSGLEGILVRIKDSASSSNDTVVVSCAGTGIKHCGLWGNHNGSPVFTVLQGYFFVSDSEVRMWGSATDGKESRAVDIQSGGGSSLRYTYIAGDTNVDVGIRHDLANVSNVFYCRLGTESGPCFATDINVISGTVYVNNTPYKVGSGNIVHTDKWRTSVSGLIEAVAASDVPLTLKGTSAQSADLTQWQDSSANVLAGVNASGIIEALAGLIAPTLKPAADSTTAVQIQTSAGVAVLNVNTTDSQVEITGNVKISAVLSLAGTAIDATKRLNLAVINSETASNPYGIYASMTQSAAAAKTIRSMYSEALGTHSSGTQTGLRAFDGLTSNNGAGIVTSLYGMYNFARNNASGTVTTMVGNLSIAQNVSTGPITNAYGIKTYVQNFGAATVDAAYLLHGYITQNNASSVITTAYGLAIADWTNAGTIGTSYGIYIGDISVGTQTNPPWSIYASDANAPSYFAGSVGVGATAPDTLVHALLTDAGTDAVVNVLTVGHDSSGTPAVGFGAGIHLTLESNTTAKQSAARIIAETVVATHASRTYRLRGTAFDAAGEREGWRVEADGTVARLGFYGVTAVVRPTALTTQLTTLTHTAPGTPDYALQNLVQNTGFGFVTADEGNSTLAVIANLQTRVGELESKLVSLGLLS